MDLKSLLAEQTVYAELIVQQRDAKQTLFQKAIYSSIINPTADEKNSQFSYKFKVNNPITGYTITSLPETVPYLPANSIFDYISYIENGDPDVRNVPVQGNRTDALLTGNIKYNPTIDENIVPKTTEANTSQELHIRPIYTIDNSQYKKTNLLQSGNLGETSTVNIDNTTSSTEGNLFADNYTQIATNANLLLQSDSMDENTEKLTRRQMLIAHGVGDKQSKLVGSYLNEIPTYKLSNAQMDKFIEYI